MNIDQKLQELGEYLPEQGKRATEVSNASVGWHIDHSLNVIQSIVGRLKETNPDDYRPPGFKLWRWIMMSTGYIPRGKVKAPKQVKTEVEHFEEQALRQKLALIEQQLSEVERLHENSYFEHPFLGHFNRQAGLRFMAVHTHHHLKIIQDILKKA